MIYHKIMMHNSFIDGWKAHTSQEIPSAAFVEISLTSCEDIFQAYNCGARLAVELNDEKSIPTKSFSWYSEPNENHDETSKAKSGKTQKRI